MAFNIVLQRCTSEKNRLTKSLTAIATVSGTLKNETSIINPVFLVEGDVSNYVRCNYLTVQAFSRSYFVTDIKTVRNGVFEITCHVDVLSTYASGIRSNFAIIKRQENSWNLYLNDGTFKIYQNPNVLTKPFPSGFNTRQFVLAVAGS